MATVDEQAEAYESSRTRIDALTRHLDAARLATVVPCCPKWTVKDLVAHLTGLLEDRAAKRLPTGGFGQWTDEQVERHRAEPIDAVLDIWLALRVERNDDAPSLTSLSFDVVTHEHDVCHALGIEGERDTLSVRVGSERAQGRMAAMLAEAGAPGVRLSTEDGELVLEGGAPPIGLATTRFGLMRLVTGRMSRAQAASMPWDGDATPVLDALFADGFFTLQPVDVVEADVG
jgi:uncharacterized protein (TIGR03083 family)